MELGDSMSPSKNEEEICTVIKEFIKTYVGNSGKKSVVIGLSGGIDSAVVSVLCKQTLGKENVLCIFLPDETTPNIDKKHQAELIKKFDLKSLEIDITSTVAQLKKIGIEKISPMTLANIKARIRMIILYKFANETDSLVCGSSNKSELLIGYYTKYGDGGVDFLPIGDLYKTQVYQLAKYLKIPNAIISKPPTAGLWLGQTDEKELKVSYETLDKILSSLEQRVELEDISKDLKILKSEVERIRNMRVTSQHKRCSPLIPKIGIRTCGIDWREPVQEG
jgi:NAD+ synthase